VQRGLYGNSNLFSLDSMVPEQTWLIRIERKKKLLLDFVFETRVLQKILSSEILKNPISRSGWLSNLSCSKKNEHLSNGVISRVNYAERRLRRTNGNRGSLSRMRYPKE